MTDKPRNRVTPVADPTSAMAGGQMGRHARYSLLGLCLLVGGSGVLHFLVPGPYRRIVPTPLRAHAAAIVAASGVCELICAALLALPRTRRFGATATAALFVAVFPANLQMALDSLHADMPLAVVAWLRLPLQAPLILWALRFRRSSRGAVRERYSR